MKWLDFFLKNAFLWRIFVCFKMSLTTRKFFSFEIDQRWNYSRTFLIKYNDIFLLVMIFFHIQKSRSNHTSYNKCFFAYSCHVKGLSLPIVHNSLFSLRVTLGENESEFSVLGPFEIMKFCHKVNKIFIATKKWVFFWH